MRKKIYRAEDLIIPKWEDLTVSQVLQVVNFVYNNDLSRVELLRVLFKDKKIFSRLNEHQVYEILYLTDWVYNSSFYRNLVPSFTLDKVEYFGPKQAFENMTVFEFSKADTYFLNYVQTHDEIFLHQLIATLYRKKKENWIKGKDCRVDFDPDLVELDAKELSVVKKSIKQYVFLFFLGCKEYIYKKYWELFENDPEEDQNKKKALHERTFGWAGVIFDLAETSVFPGLENAKRANLHTVLLYLTRKEIENQKLKFSSNGNRESSEY